MKQVRAVAVGGVVLPDDPFWLLGVRVKENGGNIPFETHVLYRLQFGEMAVTEGNTCDVEELSTEQADGVP